MILPDSSAWVELLRETGSPVDRRLTELLESRAQIAVTEPVVMEVLAGARSDRHAADLRAQLLGFRMLRVGTVQRFEEAAEIYRACRAGGSTPRGTFDCLIAAVAINADASILHLDRDFGLIARHTQLRIEPADPHRLDAGDGGG